MSTTGKDADVLGARVRFLARVEPYASLDAEELHRVATSIELRRVPAGASVLVEGGPPGTQLYFVREGTLELLHKHILVAIITGGETFGHPTLLSGLAPEFTVTAHRDSVLYCIPKDIAVELLCRPEGVRWLATNQRERLIQAARSMSALPDVRTRPVTEVVRSVPLFCEPDTSIHDAAELMIAEKRSAILVRTREGLGIVTDVDLRDKVVVGGVSREAPVSTIMTMPVHTIGAKVLAPEASIAMMAAGVNHMPVLDAGGNVVGILSASNLMTLESRSPFALRRAIQSAHDEDELVRAAEDLPKLLVDLLAAHVEAPALTRVLTVLQDSMTARLIEIAFDRHGRPPVDYAWLAFGSAARSELTLASDQDNGLAYADTDDPTADDYFRRVAEDVNDGLARCGFAADPHDVVARSSDWRMPLSRWQRVFRYCLKGRDTERLARATVSFDYRQVVGELHVDQALTDIMREAPRHPEFLKGLEQLGVRIPVPLGFRQKLDSVVDIKRNGLVPIQNLARYYAFARGITATTTLERLEAVHMQAGDDGRAEEALREAFISLTSLQLRHHARRVRAGRPLDNIIDTETLRPLTRVALQEALREVAAAQKRFPWLPLPRF